MAFTPGDGGGSDSEIQVYWRNLSDEIVVSKYVGDWTPPTKVVGGFGSGFQFSLVQWKEQQGQWRRFMLYYQNHENLVLEHCSDDGGKTWYQSRSVRIGGIRIN